MSLVELTEESTGFSGADLEREGGKASKPGCRHRDLGQKASVGAFGDVIADA